MAATARAGHLSRALHRLFGATLFVKGGLASAEALAGLGLLVTANHLIVAAVAWLTANELAQDASDPLATMAARSAAAFSIETQHFYALYLLAHGALKLAMVLLLARRVPWAYPASVVVLAGFVGWQLHEWTLAPSLPLLILSALDTLMIALVLREYSSLRPPALPA